MMSNPDFGAALDNVRSYLREHRMVALMAIGHSLCDMEGAYAELEAERDRYKAELTNLCESIEQYAGELREAFGDATYTPHWSPVFQTIRQYIAKALAATAEAEKEVTVR